MWYDLGQACFKDEEYVEALDAFGKCKVVTRVVLVCVCACVCVCMCGPIAVLQ